MNTNYTLPADQRKRNFVGMRIDNTLQDLLEKESQRREITLSDTIRRLCQERLEGLYDSNTEMRKPGSQGIPDIYQDFTPQYEYRKPDYSNLLYYDGM
jgi:hypothetical protein